MKSILTNSKGMLRIIEAAIAIFMLMAFLALLVTGQIQKPDLRDSAYRIEHQILREISNNYSLREDVLEGKLSEVNKTVEKRLSAFAFDFKTSLCGPFENCMCSNCTGDKEIYGDDILISTNLSDYEPKKLAIFLWLR